MKILVINAGSSSLKYQLIDMEGEVLLAKGLCERIGIDGKFTYKPQVEGKQKIDALDVAMPTHAEAIQAVLDALADPVNGVVASMDEIDAVGQPRAPLAGRNSPSPASWTTTASAAIKKCIPLGPLHNPANLMGIEACTKCMPGKPQVAVFDTAFHMTKPPKALHLRDSPTSTHEKGRRARYGFHGTSLRLHLRPLASSCSASRPQQDHLLPSRNGSSIAAVVDGKCVDTTMGLGPLPGVPMGTRCGDIDTTISRVYLMGKYGYDMKTMMSILNKKSGVLGISGVSSDSAIWRPPLRPAIRARSSRWTSSPTRSRNTSAPMPRPWAAWTRSSSRPASAKTARTPRRGLRGLEIHGRQARPRPQRGARRTSEHLISTDDSKVKSSSSRRTRS
jgi:acetate kinase